MKRTAPAGNQLSGILNIDKPAGLTSHDVVRRVRKLLRQPKAGHAGTLDPAATGVLLVCVGQATRLTEYLMHGRKEYRAVVHFGLTTNTYDAEGEVVASREIGDLSRAEIETALQTFVGRIEQVPPAFSAIKKGGQPAYKIARRGQQIDLPPRPVQIDSIELLAWEKPQATIRVRCHAGTYIRSLAHDLGQRLGAGAHLAALSRTASGEWRLEDAITLEALAAAVEAGTVAEVLHPPDAAVQALPAVSLTEADAQRVLFGQQIALEAPNQADAARAYTPDGEFVAILAAAGPGLWQPRKVFPPPTADTDQGAD